MGTCSSPGKDLRKIGPGDSIALAAFAMVELEVRA